MITKPLFAKWLFSCLLLYLPHALAIDQLNFKANNISTHNWHLLSAELQLSNINTPTTLLALKAKSLRLPPPFNKLNLINIHCSRFIWQNDYLACQQGNASLKTKLFSKQIFNFTFSVKNKRANLALHNLNLFGGKISLSATEKATYWQADINAKNIDLTQLKHFLKGHKLESISGHADLELKLQGDMSRIETIILSSLIKQLSLQDTQGSLASEDIQLQSYLVLKKQQYQWHWETEQTLQSGAIYIDPVYLEINPQQAMTLSASGNLQSDQHKINIQSATLTHPKTAIIQAKARLNYEKSLQLDNATINTQLLNLETISSTYTAPFITGGPLDGFKLAGKLSSQLSLTNNTLHSLDANLDSVTIDDDKQRFHANQLQGKIHWNPLFKNAQPSSINWKSLKVKAVPFDAGQLNFQLYNKHFTLLGSPNLNLLNGSIAIDEFEFNHTISKGKEVKLRAHINQLSLTELSIAMGWENTLSGTITGYIPSVNYRNDTLSLDGSLNMQLFDGEISITKLSSSGLFTDFSRFHINLDFSNLDLNEVTKKFKVGNIQGRLSGFAHDVYLENWQAVSFFAWLGTPENDDSKHLISHKAVRNIASLGGRSASDAISRGVLSWFDDFGYKKLGIGCYLHEGVCQMMGASAAKKGYYLVKGSGIPRIDIIGFNTRVDWNTLVDRLGRITSSDEIIIAPLP